MLVLLDTTILIDCLRGRPAGGRVLELRDRGDIPCTTPINVEEIARGLRSKEEAAARTLFDGVVVLALRREHGELAGKWRRDFARRGVTLAQADCLVAAVSASVGAKLATGNPKDFPMSGIEVDHWPVGK